MSKVICNRSDLVAIADAIRNKTGSNNLMTLGEMDEAIVDISGGSITHLPTCKVIFPAFTPGETLYYTDEFLQPQVYYRYNDVGQGLEINVVQNSIIVSNMSVFDGSTYLYDDEDIIRINPNSIIVCSDVSFSYADNAPT